MEKTKLPPIKHAKLLVVDDDLDILNSIKEGLEIKSVDLEILTASSGTHGLEMIKLHKPDVVILDILMPDMDGLTVLEKIKNDPDINHTKVIMLTAQDSRKNMWQSRYLEVEDFIGKPFDLFELEAIVYYQLLGKKVK